MRLVFLGTPAFAVPTLERLVEAGHQVLAVVTQPDVTMSIDQAGQNPPAVKNCIGPGNRLQADAAVDDPQFDRRLVGQAQASHAHPHGAATFFRGCPGT